MELQRNIKSIRTVCLWLDIYLFSLVSQCPCKYSWNR